MKEGYYWVWWPVTGWTIMEYTDGDWWGMGWYESISKLPDSCQLGEYLSWPSNVK